MIFEMELFFFNVAPRVLDSFTIIFTFLFFIFTVFFLLCFYHLTCSLLFLFISHSSLDAFILTFGNMFNIRLLSIVQEFNFHTRLQGLNVQLQLCVTLGYIIQ